MPPLIGGGIAITFASPRIEHNVIEANTGTNGAGLGIVGGAPAIIDNVIRDNVSPLSDNGYGGGIYVGTEFASTAPQIVGNTIIDNSSDNGAGIGMNNGGQTLIMNNVIKHNRANDDGGALAPR
jgi:hypothetical protein